MDTQLTEQNQNALVNAQNFGGISGAESEDLTLPYVYIVQDNSSHAVKKDGTKASVGEYFHGSKQESYKEMEVIILTANKTKVPNEKTNELESVWRLLVVPTSNIMAPFSVKLQGMNNWYGWRPFLNEIRELVANKEIQHISQKIVKMTTRPQEAKSQPGKVNYVPVFTITGESTTEQRELVLEITERFATKTAGDDLED